MNESSLKCSPYYFSGASESLTYSSPGAAFRVSPDCLRWVLLDSFRKTLGCLANVALPSAAPLIVDNRTFCGFWQSNLCLSQKGQPGVENTLTYTAGSTPVIAVPISALNCIDELPIHSRRKQTKWLSVSASEYMFFFFPYQSLL